MPVSEKNYGIGSMLVSSSIPLSVNIRILAKAVLQIFCSQGYLYKAEIGA